jgi:NNP family nitrate/nitrite transporter-like MFS transporter
MNVREFRQVGHWPTLLSAFLYFDVSFMIWVLIGALANAICLDFALTPLQKGFMVGVPILGGAVLRLVMGTLTDWLGGRRTALLGMTLTLGALALGWQWADTFPRLLVVGACLGLAGASFAVALPLASRWYPPEYQGLALGIAGAGNSGTAIATLTCPLLATIMSWQDIFGLAMLPLALVLLVFFALAKDSPNQPPPRRFTDYAALLRIGDAWRLCFLYSVTFGGFVGLSSFLNIYFNNEFGLSPVISGTMVTACVIAGSFLRPVGGYLADKMGGVSMLTFLYAGIGLLMLDLATSPPLVWSMILLMLIMAQLGLGNGAVFQLVPQRFPKEIGVVTGIVGAAGGVGGFVLPMILGACKQATGGYGSAFLILAVISFSALALMMGLGRSWEGIFIGKGGLATAAAPSVSNAPALSGAAASS